MITLKVDESYAFDYLAILLVKYDCSKNEMLLSQAENCIDHLKDQLEKNGFVLTPRDNKEVMQKISSLDGSKYVRKLINLVDRFISNFKKCP